MSCQISTEQQLAYQQYLQAMQQLMATMPAQTMPAQAMMPPYAMMPPQTMMGYPSFPPMMMPWAGMMPNASAMSAPTAASAQFQESGAQETNSHPLMENLSAQAQGMLDQVVGDLLGEDAPLFNDILGSLGMNDKEFWKGAMVGAAAALLLSNDTVRQKLFAGLSGAGDLLKTAGTQAKDCGMQAATNVQQAAAKNSDIFKQTYAAGKEGYQNAVAQHQAAETNTEAKPEQTSV